MPVWINLRPKLSFEFLGIGVGVEFPPTTSIPGGPPVSLGRFERARTLADETIAAVQADDLPKAVDRLMTLADEYSIAERAAAVKASNRMRLMTEGLEVLSEVRQQERKEELIGLILDAVGSYLDAADLADNTADAASLHHELLPKQSSDADAPTRAHTVEASTIAPAIRCCDLGWCAEGRWILRDINVDLARGSVVGVVGRNGAGKTTLLRLIAQDLRPSTGSVAYPALSSRGYRAERLLDRIAYVPQIPTAYEGSLEDHLQRFAALRGLQGRAREDEVAYVLERFGLGDAREKHWAALPGGFKTRVELARSTLASPEILILDEPLGPLDGIAQREYLRQLRDLADSRRQVCVVITSQDVHAVADIADHIIVIKDGLLPFAGPPADIEQMTRHRAYEFSGELSIPGVKTALSALPQIELRDDGMKRTLVTDETVTARAVLEALLAGGETVWYFRDLSRSPQQLLENFGVSDGTTGGSS